MNSIAKQVTINPNGIDTNRIIQLATRLSQDSSFSQFRFKVHNEWNSGNGSRSRTTIKDFYAGNTEQTERLEPLEVYADQPEFLAGKNTAPNAVEHYLHSLVSCINTTVVAHAAVQGILISRLDISAEGQMDARGFFGVSDDVSRGYTRINLNISVKANIDEESFRKLMTFSPVYEMVSKAMQVDVILNIAPQR